MNLSDLDIAIGLFNSSTHYDDCQCDSSVGYVCEVCFTHHVLCECKREIVRLMEKCNET